MFYKKLKSNEEKLLDIEIGSMVRQLQSYHASHDDKEYDRIVTQLERLYKLKEMEKPQRVSPDTWALIGANLLGIALIMTHEFTHPITTKALNFAIKPK